MKNERTTAKAMHSVFLVLSSKKKVKNSFWEARNLRHLSKTFQRTKRDAAEKNEGKKGRQLFFSLASTEACPLPKVDPRKRSCQVKKLFFFV